MRAAKDLCLRKLGARPRARAELRAALDRAEVAPAVAEHVLDRLEAAGLIDDADFARTWVRSRHTHKGLGRKALRAELLRKGIAAEVADEALAAVDTDAEADRARELVRRRLPSLGQATGQAALRRLVALLARRGYSEGLAYTIAREELAAVREHGPEPSAASAEPAGAEPASAEPAGAEPDGAEPRPGRLSR